MAKAVAKRPRVAAIWAGLREVEVRAAVAVATVGVVVAEASAKVAAARAWAAEARAAEARAAEAARVVEVRVRGAVGQGRVAVLEAAADGRVVAVRVMAPPVTELGPTGLSDVEAVTALDSTVLSNLEVEPVTTQQASLLQGRSDAQPLPILRAGVATRRRGEALR